MNSNSVILATEAEFVHSANHLVATTLRCFTCNMDFYTTQDFEFHEREVHHRNFICHPCSQSFDTKDALDMHNFEMHPHQQHEQSFGQHLTPADGNDTSFMLEPAPQTPMLLQQPTNALDPNHLPSHSQQQVANSQCQQQYQNNQCPICGLYFSDFDEVYRHRQVFHSEAEQDPSMATFSCHLCHKVFPNQIFLQDHVVTHQFVIEGGNPRDLKAAPDSDEENENQTIPSVVFNSPDVDEKKIKATPDGRYRCYICDQVRKNKDKVKAHIERMHFGLKTRNVKMLKCNLCERTFDSDDGLLDHLQFAHMLAGEDARRRVDGAPVVFQAQRVLSKKKSSENKLRSKRVEHAKITLDELDMNRVTFDTHFKKYKCYLCNKLYTSMKSARDHIRHLHIIKSSNDDSIASLTEDSRDSMDSGLPESNGIQRSNSSFYHRKIREIDNKTEKIVEKVVIAIKSKVTENGKSETLINGKKDSPPRRSPSKTKKYDEMLPNSNKRITRQCNAQFNLAKKKRSH